MANLRGSPRDEEKRGINEVFKWFAVRRWLVQYKDELGEKIAVVLMKTHQEKKILTKLNQSGVITTAIFGAIHRRAYLKGYLAAMTEVRQDLRKMCHSDRWQVQDNDRMAAKWLEAYGGGGEWDQKQWDAP
jgi:hypothetical protein